MARRSPNLLSIPPGKPFLATLVRALLDGELISDFPNKGDPLSLARATLLLPTRRACRAVIDSFLDLGGPALLLPRIRAIADEDEEGGLIDEMSTLGDGFVDIPPAVPPLLRRTTLMRLILAWDKQRRLSAPMLSPMREVIFGLLIVLFLIFEPHGLAEMWRRLRRFFHLWPFRT